MVYMKLLELINNTGYNIVQQNGQRKFGPPKNWVGPPPPKGCEVFIGKLHREVFEDELVPLFSKVGQIYELRMMLNFSGSNRGFAFLKYTSRAEASAAIRELHNYQIRPGYFIAVVKSVDNCRLYLGGIPKNKTKEDIHNELSMHVSGIVDIILYKNCFNRRHNRGFAFVEFMSHEDAVMARRVLTSGSVRMWDSKITIDWAEPEPEVDEELLQQVKILYVRNLCVSTPQETIRDVFKNAAGYAVERVKKIYDYAFVHFYKREHAEIALDKLNNVEIDGLKMEITWAKPVDRQLYKVQKLLKGNSKFTRCSPKAFNNAMCLYQKKMNEIVFDDSLPDEGIASAVVSDTHSGSPNNLVAQQSSGIIYQEGPNPIVDLEELSNKLNFPSPTYQFQKCIQPDWSVSWVCKIGFGNMHIWQLTSIPCLTTEQAQMYAAYICLTYIKTNVQNVMSGNTPQVYQPNMAHTVTMTPAVTTMPHQALYSNPAIPGQIW